MLKIISKYAKQLKTFQLSWNNGFYILPYFGNSPEHLIEGLDHMPFVKVDKDLETISSNSMFLEAFTYYLKIKDGLWVTCGKVNYKKNISYKRIQDDDIKSKYYFLSLEITRGSEKKISTLVNGYIYKDYSWLLFKPDVSNSHSHLSNSTQESITIWFDEQYIHETLLNEKEPNDSKLSKFLKSDQPMVIMPADTDFSEDISKKISDLLADKIKGEKINSEMENLVDLLFKSFSESYSTSLEDHDISELDPTMTRKMLKANAILMEYLLRDDFEGIEWLAQKISMSPTYLKQNFKKVYGESVYQHLKKKKLMFARELLKTTDVDIKEIAFTIGYHNPAKFSSAFKEEFGESPTQLRNK